MKSKNGTPIILVGARLGGQAGAVLDILSESDEFRVIGFIDNSPGLVGTQVNGIPIIGSSDDIDSMDFPTQFFHISIGDNVARHELYKKLKKRGCNLVSVIHSSALISKSAQIGEGSFIGRNVVVNNEVKIGCVSIINTSAILEHNNVIKDAVQVAPGCHLAGRVEVGDWSFLGIGSTILPDIKIGSGAMIGAGAIVTKNVPNSVTMIGLSAIPYSETKSEYHSIGPDVEAISPIYVAQPTLPKFRDIERQFEEILNTKMISNFAKYSMKLEEEIENLFSVRRALTVPNLTTGLTLAIKALNLKGEIILPSFTFSSTGHAAVWNGLTPVFADIDPKTFNIDIADVERKITANTSAILAVHIFGNPCDVEALESISNRHQVKLIFDSAHALGSRYRDNWISHFGDLEGFSLSGTKVVTSAEGGILTSNNDELMERIHLGRNYGASSDYDCQYIGVNGKMSEFLAVIALEGLRNIHSFSRVRNEIAHQYRQALNNIPGIQFQLVDKRDFSVYKDFAIVIDEEQFGISRDTLHEGLIKRGIFGKKYFFPPLHKMKAYSEWKPIKGSLPNTDYISDHILCLPIYNHMESRVIDRICSAILEIQQNGN